MATGTGEAEALEALSAGQIWELPTTSGLINQRPEKQLRLKVSTVENLSVI